MDTIKEVLEGLFVSFVWEFVLAGIVAAVIAYLKAKKEKWAGPALYAFGAFVLVFVLGFTLTGRAPLAKGQLQSTPETIEADIRAWADNRRCSVQKVDAREAWFLYSLTLPDGFVVGVGRAKGHEDNYVRVAATLSTSAVDAAAIGKLSKAKKSELTIEVELELDKLGIESQVISEDDAISSVNVFRLLRINGLTEDDFDAAVQQVQSAIRVADRTEALTLNRFSNPVK